jgi:hypothetical protein
MTVTFFPVKPKTTDAIALLTLIFAICSPSIWGRLYHQNNSLGFLITVISLLWLSQLAILGIVTVAVRSLSGLRLLRCIVVILAVVCLSSLLASYFPIQYRFWWTATLALAIGATCYIALGKSDLWWPRLRQSLLVGALLFVASGPLLGFLLSKDHNLLPAVKDDDRLPTIWILLDETSAGAANLLIAPLLKQGLSVSLTTVAPAGDNTLDIVPSLITRQLFGPDVALCGWRMLCGRSKSLDMGRVHVGREDVDLIGTYHSWCALRGWRSCVIDKSSDDTWITQAYNLICELRVAITIPTVDCSENRIRKILAVREASMSAERNAPFWREGGDLIVHILLPHLPASVEQQPSVEVAYEKNLSLTANYLDDIATRLRLRFPEGFRLVAFSDHPLRPITNCDELFYLNCVRPPRYAEPYQVPVIVAAMDDIMLPAMENNLRLFDLDLRAQKKIKPNESEKPI